MPLSKWADRHRFGISAAIAAALLAVVISVTSKRTVAFTGIADISINPTVAAPVLLTQGQTSFQQTFTGLATDSNKNPVPNATLYAFSTDQNSGTKTNVGQTTTKSDGTYSIKVTLSPSSLPDKLGIDISDNVTNN